MIVAIIDIKAAFINSIDNSRKDCVSEISWAFGPITSIKRVKWQYFHAPVAGAFLRF